MISLLIALIVVGVAVLAIGGLFGFVYVAGRTGRAGR